MKLLDRNEALHWKQILLFTVLCVWRFLFLSQKLNCQSGNRHTLHFSKSHFATTFVSLLFPLCLTLKNAPFSAAICFYFSVRSMQPTSTPSPLASQHNPMSLPSEIIGMLVTSILIFSYYCSPHFLHHQCQHSLWGIFLCGQ